jgi:steroid delta-isomerase-like uncharacterized protein
MPKPDLPDPSARRRPRSFAVSGTLLSELRASRDWTQQEAAHKAGFSDRLIRKAEAGKKIDVHTITILAKLYSTSDRVLTPQDLLAEPRSPSSSEPLAPPAPDQSAMSPIQELVVRWFAQIWNERRLKAIDELAAPDIVLHAEGRQFRGRRSIRRRFAELHAAFSNTALVMEELTARDDSVICRWRLAMTHTGPWLGWPATNKRLIAHGSSWMRIESGLIRESWEYWEQQQLSDAIRGGESKRTRETRRK